MIRILSLLLVLCTVVVANDSKLIALSYNIRYDAKGDRFSKDWDNRKSSLTNYLNTSQASIIGLQEALHNQLRDVDKALPNHGYVGVGRDDGKSRGEHTPIFYDKRHWQLDRSQHGTFWLSDRPHVVASKSWGNSITRICTWARLTGKNGKAIYVYNTHWDHRSQTSREQAAKLILKMIRTRKHRHDPYILMGDLNANTDNRAVQTLLRSGLLVDHGKQQFNTFSSWKNKLSPGKRIDHIFTSPSFKRARVVVQTNRNTRWSAASDHHPVLLTTH